MRVSVDISVPFVVGLRRPIVLFPAGLIERLSMDEVRQVFLHELAHVRRRDCWVQHAICFLQALFWPNLLLHKVRRRLNHLQDLDCDAAAISQHPDRSPVAYRRMLLKVAGRALGLSFPDPRQGLGLFRRPSQIMERLRFTEQRWRTTPKVRLLGAATLALLVATFLFPMGSEPAGRPGEGLSPRPMAPLVEAVEFTGNRILSDRDLLQLVATRAGNTYDPERLYDDLNDLMRTTLFGKVTGRLQVGKKGIIVRFEFEETRLRPEP